MADRQNSAVMMKDAQPNAKGSWVQIGTGEGTYTWDYGFIPIDTTEEPKELFEKLRLEIA